MTEDASWDQFEDAVWHLLEEYDEAMGTKDQDRVADANWLAVTLRRDGWTIALIDGEES